MAIEQDPEYTVYLARGGRLHPADHAEVRRRTTETGRVYNGTELAGIDNAHELARSHGLSSIPIRVAAAYHHLRSLFSSYFRDGQSNPPNPKLILREAVAIEGDTSSLAKLH